MERKMSKLARALYTLVDKADVYDRRGWSHLLRVSEVSIERWLNDEAVPSPEALCLIMEFLERLDSVPRYKLREFQKIRALPLEEVTPHATRIRKMYWLPGDTLAHYMIVPLLQDSLHILKGIPPEMQKEVLKEAKRLCEEKASLLAGSGV